MVTAHLGGTVDPLTDGDAGARVGSVVDYARKTSIRIVKTQWTPNHVHRDTATGTASVERIQVNSQMRNMGDRVLRVGDKLPRNAGTTRDLFLP